MGFSNTLKSNIVDEWKDYYVDYNKLKSKTKNTGFKGILYTEVNKINGFYLLLEKKAVDEKDSLFSDIVKEFPGEAEPSIQIKTRNTDGEMDSGKSKGVVEIEDVDDKDTSFISTKNDIDNIESTENENKSMMQSESFSSLIPLNKRYTKRKKEKHFTEFLHSLLKIKAYRDLNATGLLKLAKKYATANHDDGFYTKFNYKLKKTYFCKSKRIDSIRNAVKRMYKQIFAKGEPEKAKTVFKRLGRGNKTLDVFYMLSGLLIGSATTVLMWNYGNESAEYNMMAAINNILLGFVFFGLCLKICKNVSINYKFIFNFDVVSPMNNSIYLLIVSVFIFVNTLLFVIGDTIGAYSTYLEIMLPIVFLFNPLDMFFLNSRIYLASVYGKGLFLPLSTIRFRHFYFIDILQSFKYPITTIIGYFINNVVSRRMWTLSIYAILPFLRILQCLKRSQLSGPFFPHVANAMKYALIFALCICDVFSFTDDTKLPESFVDGLKYVPRFIATIISFNWDILVDWTIQRNSHMFPKPFYLLAILVNFFIRFIWVFRIAIGFILKQKTMPESPIIMSILEIFRRSVWTIIRVEVEHLNNCDKLKLKKTINLTAGELFYRKDIDESYQAKLDDIFTETEFETEMEDATSSTKGGDVITESITASEDESHIEYDMGVNNVQIESIDLPDPTG